MSPLPTDFNGRSARKFSAYAKTVRGYVRYELTKQNLLLYLQDKAGSLRVADIGGGSGIDAAWLAQLGHHVTVIEPATDQLAEARRKLDQLPADIRSRISLQPGTAETLLKTKPTEKFDVVLSHGVAMYLPDPPLFINQLASLLKRGGCISLLEKGFYGALYRLEQKNNHSEVSALVQDRRFTNNMNRKVWAFLPEELSAYLKSSGCSRITWSGVRIWSEDDGRLVDELLAEQVDETIKLEAQIGRRNDTRGLGQMLHFIAVKR